MEQQAYDLAALFTTEENLIGAKTGAGSITMKGTVDDENSEMNAALFVDGHLDTPEKQSPPHNEEEKDTTNGRCKCYHRCISHCGADGCKISDGLCANPPSLPSLPAVVAALSLQCTMYNDNVQ
jgi:hypothetical protein